MALTLAAPHTQSQRLRLPRSVCQASFALLSETEFLVTLHRVDAQPTIEVYQFYKGLDPETIAALGPPVSNLPETLLSEAELPLVMAHFCLPILCEDVQVDLDVRPDPPFPPSSMPSALGNTKPFTDDPEQGVLTFNMTALAQTLEQDFTHLTIVTAKQALMSRARAHYKQHEHASIMHLVDEITSEIDYGDGPSDSSPKFAGIPWRDWGPESSRVFEDDTPSVNWVSDQVCHPMTCIAPVLMA